VGYSPPHFRKGEGYAYPSCRLKLRLFPHTFVISTFSFSLRLFLFKFHVPYTLRLLGSRVVRMLDSDAEGPGFKSQPRRCWVTVLGKLLTPIVPRAAPSPYNAITKLFLGLVSSLPGVPSSRRRLVGDGVLLVVARDLRSILIFTARRTANSRT